MSSNTSHKVDEYSYLSEGASFLHCHIKHEGKAQNKCKGEGKHWAQEQCRDGVSERVSELVSE